MILASNGDLNKLNVITKFFNFVNIFKEYDETANLKLK